ncbi:hypothetical protein DSL72_003153 [Monilinia vaccinii-corymbosi]|uniref:Ubiquitin-like domain-containing protein n=1 Tax=Monilinia vaccinii-corymbosi TaxID=61207 RepID=A0A8A3NZ04_9HELO|nr:hypothetical protein DSL72_003153 [Monilinia vaccinii-corymbosi]
MNPRQIVMPESNQYSSPPPAYIKHGDVSATRIDILHGDSERSSRSPTIPQSISIDHEIPEDQVLATQPVVRHSLVDLATSAPWPGSGTAEIIGAYSDRLISQLERAIQHLESSHEDRLIARLETLLSRQADADARPLGLKRDTRRPIKLKDAVGRQFSFPYHRCETWTGIEELIKAIFVHVEVVGPHVNGGHYDIINAAGEVILPQLWGDHVQPGWEVSMKMWPMPTPKPRSPPPPPGESIHVIVDRFPGPPPPPPPPPAAAPCSHTHLPPTYSPHDVTSVSKKRGVNGLWQKVQGVFTKKKLTNYDSDTSGSLDDD